MFKISTTVIAAIVAVSAFASHAEARSGGSFYASPFFRNQGRQPAQPHCANEESRRFEALNRARQRRLAEIRAERAQAAFAAKRARLAALEKKKTAAAKATELAAANAPKPTLPVTTTVAQKGDLLPIAETTAAPITTASVTKTAEVCRKFSPAADGLIEIPCK